MPSMPVNDALPGSGALKRRLDKIEKSIKYLRTSRNIVGRATVEGGKSLIVKGLLSVLGSINVKDGGDVNVTDGGNVIISGGGDIQILDDADNVVWSALDGPLKAASAQVDLNSTTFTPPATWLAQITTTVDVPPGYTQAFVNLFVSAGATITDTSGNVGVWPVVEDYSGPGISNGVQGPVAGGPVSVSSFCATTRTGLAGGTITLQAWCQVTGGVDPGSCNAHLSASIVFLR